MKITIFTGNQPRHVSLIERFAGIADEVYAVQECSTVFPGRVDDFFHKSPVMQDYFCNVIAAEERVFGGVRFSASNVRSISIKSGDLNKVDIARLQPALESDCYVVFGASYIKSPLVDFLIDHNAINIHMGLSPYYRGNSCNFWAIYDGHPELVGATIHRLSRGLDSGGMLFHVLPVRSRADPFLFGMRAVKAAQVALGDAIASGAVFSYEPVQQDKRQQIRYSRNADFTDEVAREYLNRAIGPDDLIRMVEEGQQRPLLHPVFGGE